VETKLFISCLVLISSLFAGAAQEVPQAPPWARPGVIKLAMAIDMRAEQIPGFRAETGIFVESFYSMVKKELRRNSVDKKRTIERRTRKLTKKLDKTMGVILDEGQIPAYKNYRDALVLSLSTPRKQALEIQSSPDVVQHH